MCPAILFKIAVCVSLSFGKNLFQRKKFSIDVPSSKWSVGPLVKVLFCIFEACEGEFNALSQCAHFAKICFPEYCLKSQFASLSLFWHKSFSAKKFSIEVPSSKWSAGRLVKFLFLIL